MIDAANRSANLYSITNSTPISNTEVI